MTVVDGLKLNLLVMGWRLAMIAFLGIQFPKPNKTMTRKKIETLINRCHSASLKAGWWAGTINMPEKLCLIHSELSEATLGILEDKMDDKLPHRKMEEVEMADAFIRACDYIGKHGWLEMSPFKVKGLKPYEKRLPALAVLHLRVSLAMEALRKDQDDAHREHMQTFLVECIHYCNSFDLDLEGAIKEKIAFNAKRKDHKIEERAKPGGKKF